MQDYYEVLGVDRNATDDVIKRVYRQLVRAYHPDVMPDSEAGVARLKWINAAYETLKDPDKRRRYDLGLGIRPTAQSPRSGDRSSQGSKGAQAAEAERARHAREAEERARRDRAEQEQADRLRRAAEKEAERRREAARKAADARAAEEAERRRDDAPRPAPHRPTAPPLDGAGRVVPKLRGQRRNAWLVAVAAVAVIAVLAVAGVIWATTRGGESKLNSGVAIGDPYQGGVLAYILQPGDPGYSSTAEHGLVAATADQSDGIVWALPANQGTSVAGATGTAIGTGAANTDAIIAQNGVGSSYAAGLARAYHGGGYSDWYLPSRDELNKLYLNKTAIGGFETTTDPWYWSSSQGEYDPSGVWDQGFGDGDQGDSAGKFHAARVRAVRAF